MERGTARWAYTVAANTATNPRTGTLTIAGQTLTVTQSGSGYCSFTIAPNAQTAVAAGGSFTTAVTTTSGCAWTGARSDASWITVTSGGSGTGNGTVAYTVAAKRRRPVRAPRRLTIAGQVVTVTQAGACSFQHRPDGAKRDCGWRVADSRA